MMILYACDGEGPAVMRLDTLLRNFEETEALEKHLTPDEIRSELEARGWFEGLHDNGRYLILNMDKHDAHICPTPDAWDDYYAGIEALKDTQP